MLFLGVFLMIAASFVVYKEYSVYLGREARELRELIAFIRTMRERMKCYLEPPSAWIESYSTPELERVGFLGAIRNGADLQSAFEIHSDRMCVADDVKTALTVMLCGMGDSYLDGELASIDIATEKLCGIEKRVGDDYKNKTRAAGAMIAAITVGVVILVI